MGPKDTFPSTWKTVFLLWLWVRAGSALLAAQEGRAQFAHPVLASGQCWMQEHGPAWHPTVSPTCHQGCDHTALGCGRAIVPPFLPLCCAVALGPGSEMQRGRCYRARGIVGFPLYHTSANWRLRVWGEQGAEPPLCLWRGMFSTHRVSAIVISFQTSFGSCCRLISQSHERLLTASFPLWGRFVASLFL